jgi:CheY-like chemotaxis protein
MDGYDLARRLRSLRDLGDIKLVAITGYGLESDRARTVAAGFDQHLVKPVEMKTLQSTLEKITGREQVVNAV